MKFRFILFFIFCTSIESIGQHHSDTLSSPITKTINLTITEKALNGQQNIYTGADYREDPRITDAQHPYYFSKDWTLGSILYFNKTFFKVPLLFNIATGQVITGNFLTSKKMHLITEKIKSFSIHSHTFIRIQSVPGLTDGFYDLLYDGRTQLLASRKKIMEEKIEANALHISFNEKSNYFIKINDRYYTVKNKSSFLSLMGNKKEELKKWAKSNHLKFRKNEDNFLVRNLEYFDRLEK